MTTNTRTWLLLAGACAAVALALVAFASTSTADAPEGVEIEYQGQLLDEDRRPIAGIFPLEFLLYRREDDSRALWKERHWVAVQGGRYTIRLGGESPIRANIVKPGENMFLGVNLADGGELTREPISIPSGKTSDQATPPPQKVAEAPAEKAEPEKAEPEKAEPEKAEPVKAEAPKAPKNIDKAPAEGFKTEASFAEVAEFARKARMAEDSEKLGGKSLEELEAEIERLRTLVAELRTSQKEGSVTIGTDTTVLPRVGGTGGSAYVRECPPGYVVTGIRGSSGALLDSIQLICSPLR